MLWTPRAPGQALEGMSFKVKPRGPETPERDGSGGQARNWGKETWPTREK